MLERIRQTAQWVAQEADYVTIDRDALQRVAAEMPIGQVLDRTWDTRFHYHDQTQPEKLAAFVIALDAINFGSGYFQDMTYPQERYSSGYYFVANQLKDYFEQKDGLTPDELMGMTSKTVANLFKQEPKMPLMDLFAQAWQNLGVAVKSAGSFIQYIKQAEQSADVMVVLLAQQTGFRDIWLYKGCDVPILKRAQITVSDLHLAFGGKGLGQFDGRDQLTLFADNRVPAVLAADGVLNYNADLMNRLANRELLEPGEPAEVEIRACTVHAGEELRTLVETLHPSHVIETWMLDNYLWERGQAMKKNPAFQKMSWLAHRTRGVSY